MQLNKTLFPGEITKTGSFHAADEQSWNYLPFSEEEVEQIKNSGTKNLFPVTLISGEQATEESLKELQGKRSPAVLHIATHGFFFPDPEQQKENKSVNQNVFKYAANPLMRSGLFFAGAYYTWTKNRSFTGLEDGIATAYEIANLYLPNSKLAVLSACETGLGDIRGSDGVWGLQRAFRIAGVKNLVMSLWKVPDRETSEFMTLFYENIFRQQTIADAFIATQAAMKNKYRNDPYKWAAFILVR
jgi:CHAT domain-containing protein